MTEDNELIEQGDDALIEAMARAIEQYEVGPDRVQRFSWRNWTGCASAALTAYRNHQVEL